MFSLRKLYHLPVKNFEAVLTFKVVSGLNVAGVLFGQRPRSDDL